MVSLDYHHSHKLWMPQKSCCFIPSNKGICIQPIRSRSFVLIIRIPLIILCNRWHSRKEGRGWTMDYLSTPHPQYKSSFCVWIWLKIILNPPYFLIWCAFMFHKFNLTPKKIDWMLRRKDQGFKILINPV